MILKYKLPMKVSANAIYAGMFWRKRKKIKDTYGLIKFETIDPSPFTYPVTLAFRFALKRKIDVSNLSYMAKMIEDLLVSRGILEGDSPKYVFCVVLTQTSGKDECKIFIS